MASMIFNSALFDEAKGNINYNSDTFKVMLVTSTYAPNKDTHTKRSDVTNEVTGTGYTAGGAAATVSVGAVDTVNDRVDVTLGGTNWATATITARGAVYYKSRGGAATADELVAYIDFGADITSTAAQFALTASTLRKTNP
jgi:hypothetical protein